MIPNVDIDIGAGLLFRLFFVAGINGGVGWSVLLVHWAVSFFFSLERIAPINCGGEVDMLYWSEESSASVVCFAIVICEFVCSSGL